MLHEMPRLNTTSNDKNELILYAKSEHQVSAAHLVARSMMKMIAAMTKYFIILSPHPAAAAEQQHDSLFPLPHQQQVFFLYHTSQHGMSLLFDLSIQA